MEDSDRTAQLPLPSLPGKTTAQVLRLPLPSRAKSKPRKKRKRDRSLWYALHFPQLETLPESRQEKMLETLAGLAQGVSSTVSFHPQALVCEIRSSLKYFGGMEAIHDKLAKLVHEQLGQWQLEPARFSYAVAPTVSGSLLLARAGHNKLVYRKSNLRAALGQLPADVLRLDKEQHRRLYNMGVRYLRDLWRLPMDGLRKRFGSELVNRVNRALGKAPEPTHNYLPPPLFNTSYELPYELENLDRLLPVVDEMLSQLCDFLQQRDLCTAELRFSLRHEQRDHTPLLIGLRQPGRSRGHFMTLMETHFSRLSLPAPVIAVRLEVDQFDAYMVRSLALPGHGDSNHGDGTSLNRFMEQLQARLGDESLSNIMAVAEHCPEYASRQLDYEELVKTASNNNAVGTNPRPLWLLAQPCQLTVRHGKLYHRKPVAIISGPERIETRWWSGEDQRRDYYVAQESDGSRLWIYRDRRGERNWFLHGYFA